MASYHFHLNFISRKQGRSAVAAAAYRAGEKLHNKYDGQTHDFTNKRGITHTEIMLPENAPPEFADRETFWNAVELNEKRRDARTAREIEIALPNELTRGEQIELVREYVRNNLLCENMCVDIAIHAGKHYHSKSEMQELAEHDNIITPDNPHAHIMFADRPMGKNGKFENKNPSWNKKERLISWRKEWADIQNREFERKGLEIRVSHESNADREIDREPTKHLGHEAHAMEKRGIRTERGDENRVIMARNKAKEEREKNRQHEREQNRGRSRDRDREREQRRSQPKEQEPTRAVARDKSASNTAPTRTHTNFGNGGTKTLFEVIREEDRKGRAKAKAHIEEIKATVEKERLQEEAERAKTEKLAREQYKEQQEREQRKAEREQKRAEEREQRRNRDRDRDSPSRSR